jgi:hypothetical protein
MATLGFDPEYLVVEAGNTARPVPVCGKVGGTKEEPIMMPDWGEGFGYHEDNVAVELCAPPSEDEYVAADYLMTGIAMLDEVLKDKKLARYKRPEAKFLNSQLRSEQATQFGCEPDFDAYTGGRSPRAVKEGQFGNMRFAGGHIHLGGEFNCPQFVVALFCDLAIGGFMRMNQRPISPYRMKWYGQPGIFRPKEYGVEYRTLDNSWTTNSSLRQNVLVRAMSVARFCEDSTPTQIKKLVDSIEWLTVKEYIGGKKGIQEKFVEQQALAAAQGIYV